MSLQRLTRVRPHKLSQHVNYASLQPSLSNFSIDSRSPLGVGAHSSVFWARPREGQGSVAMKVMAPFAAKPTLKNGELSRAIQQETRVFDEIMSRNEMHPNVVDFVMNFETTGHAARDAGLFLANAALDEPVHVFISEFLGGGSLSDAIDSRVRSGKMFDADQVLDVATAVSEGLKFLHRRGVVHRDVKPQNLVYDTSRKQLKLIDFSIAGIANDTQMPTSMTSLADVFSAHVGTYGYMAPEVLILKEAGIDGDHYGTKCDIFSLGCVLHAMLTGVPPDVTVGKSVRVTTYLDRTLSAPTRAFISDMLAVDPNDRPKASEILEVCKGVTLRSSNHTKQQEA